MSDSIPRERVLTELRALREVTQELGRRLDTLIGDIDGDAKSDPRIVEIARRAIAELRAKQHTKVSPVLAARNADKLGGSSGRGKGRLPK